MTREILYLVFQWYKLMQVIDVTCAIITIDDKILVVQRSPLMKLPLKWEFPGGKIEIGESETECITREIREELNIEIDIFARLTPSYYKYPSTAINLIPFLAAYRSGNIILKEHIQFKIIHKNQLSRLDWAEADLPILNEFLNL